MHWKPNAVIGTTLLNRYRIDAELGRGGMGTVYRGHDLWLDRPVAVKVLARGELDAEHRARLRREARAAAKLNHPNIVSVFDINETEGVPFIVMEFVDGCTLREAGPLTLAQIMRLAAQLCEALDHAHAQGIVHRDLKPENVMLVGPTGRQSVKLMDLGLAQARGAPHITSESAVIGTALYMAPEQSMGRPVDGRADLYALGVMLFELCAGHRPYDGADLISVLMQHWSAPIPSLAKANPDVSSALDSIVQKLLAKQPEYRYQSAREVCGALQATPEAEREALLAPGSQPDAAPTQYAVTAASPLNEITSEDWPLDPVPSVPDWVGRAAELERCGARLDARGLLVIEGMAGTGKTALGAMLARLEMARGRAVCWVSLDPTGKNSTEAILWDIAAFLADDGKHELWVYLREEARRQESPDAGPSDRARRLAVLLSALQRGRYTLCLDNVHVLARGADPEFAYLFGELRKRIESRPDAPPAHLLIMARELAPAIRSLSDGPLGGLSAEDTELYLSTHDLRLPADALRALHAKVEGNPQLLRLSLPGLQARCADPPALARFINGLASQQNVRDFLIESLSPTAAEQKVLDALAVFTSPVAREAVEELLADDTVPDLHAVIDRLVQTHQVDESPESGDIALHSLAREYAYARLDRARRLRLHAAAAAYMRARRDPLAAAYQYRMARAYGEAAQAIIGAGTELMRRGRLDAMLEQIDPLAREQVGDDTWLALCHLRGNALYRRGAYERAATAYEEALAVAPPDAQPDLHNRLGRCWQARGRFADALTAYRQELTLAESLGDRAQMAEAHMGIGRVSSRRAEFDNAVRHFQEAAALGEQLDDSVFVARAQGNLGLVYHQRGQLGEALESGQRSLAAFRKAGRVELVASALGNLGIVYHERQEFNNAATYYQQAIQIYEQLGDPYYLVVAYNNLGELRLAQGRPAEAVAELQRCAAIAEQTSNDYMRAVVSANLAEAYLVLGNITESHTFAKLAVELSQAVGAQQHEGIARAKLAKVHARLGQAAAAQAEFESAVKLLAQVGHKPELARAHHAFGEHLLTTDTARGRAHLEQARTLYHELGSTAEADKVTATLAALA